MKKSCGFTLIETLVTIAVLAVLATLAIPSYRDFIEKSHLRGAAEAVYEQLQYARSQSLKRSTPVIVDFWIDPTDATKTTWSLGITDDSECWALADPSTCPTWGCNADTSVDPSVTPDTACVVEYDNDRTVDSDGDGNPTDPILMRLDSTDFRDITMKGSGGISPSFCTTSGATCLSTTSGPGACATKSATEACFEPIQGLSRKTKTTDPSGHIQIGSEHYKLQVSVDESGKVRVCVPTGTVLGYEPCT